MKTRVKTGKYQYVHGARPSGFGLWMLRCLELCDENLEVGYFHSVVPCNYSDALRKARRLFKADAARYIPTAVALTIEVAP